MQCTTQFSLSVWKLFDVAIEDNCIGLTGKLCLSLKWNVGIHFSIPRMNLIEWYDSHHYSWLHASVAAISISHFKKNVVSLEAKNWISAFVKISDVDKSDLARIWQRTELSGRPDKQISWWKLRFPSFSWRIRLEIYHQNEDKPFFWYRHS